MVIDSASRDLTGGQVAEMHQRGDAARAQVAEAEFQVLAVIEPQRPKQHARGEVVLRVNDGFEVVRSTASHDEPGKKNDGKPPNRNFCSQDESPPWEY